MVVFSWLERPPTKPRVAGVQDFMNDERLKDMPDMPFERKA